MNGAKKKLVSMNGVRGKYPTSPVLTFWLYTSKQPKPEELDPLVQLLRCMRGVREVYVLTNGAVVTTWHSWDDMESASNALTASLGALVLDDRLRSTWDNPFPGEKGRAV